jgi:hypothetical protein
VELHQFRIEASAGQIGEPTPEGLHRDGVDWVLVALVNRTNVESGVTSIYGMDHRHLGDFTLTDPLDAVFLRDNRVFHGVTTIRRWSPIRPRASRCRGHHLLRSAAAPAAPVLRHADANASVANAHRSRIFAKNATPLRAVADSPLAPA